MGKQSQYEAGRLDGLDLALRIARESGVEGLEKQVKMRGAWGIHTHLAVKELDEATERIKQITIQTVQVAALSILHDTFGFGKVRCQRFMKSFDKLCVYLNRGWLYWYDLITEINNEIQLDLRTDIITETSMGTTYAHPEPEDIYSENDLVVEEEWKAILKELGFSEEAETDEEGWNWIRDEEGKRFIRWKGQFNKIQVYDTLCGIALAKDHYGIE